MNRINLLFFVFIVCLSVKAQERECDIVYLKNKQVFYGKIIKNDFGLVSLVVTQGDSTKIVKFEHYDILKIEQGINVSAKDLENSNTSKEIGGRRVFTQDQLGSLKSSKVERRDNLSDLTIAPDYDKNNNLTPSKAYESGLSMAKTGVAFERDPLAPVPDKRALREWTREIRGFRGFLEYSYNFGLDKVRNNTIDLSKSIGFQFNPIIYLGAGVAYKLSTNKESSLPVFINPRLNMTDHEDINPFWDVKIGYSPVAAKGTFFSTSLGSSFVVGRKGKYAINLGLTYSFLNGSFKKNIPEASKVKIKEDYHQIGLTLGFEY